MKEKIIEIHAVKNNFCDRDNIVFQQDVKNPYLV